MTCIPHPLLQPLRFANKHGKGRKAKPDLGCFVQRWAFALVLWEHWIHSLFQYLYTLAPCFHWATEWNSLFNCINTGGVFRLFRLWWLISTSWDQQRLLFADHTAGRRHDHTKCSEWAAPSHDHQWYRGNDASVTECVRLQTITVETDSGCWTFV